MASLELAIENRLTGLPANTLLGRNTGDGVAEAISQSKFATPAMIDQTITDLVGGAPGALNTLKELAAALNNDANFSSTIINLLNSKAPIANPNFNGFTTLGDNIAIKCKVIETLTSSTQGGYIMIAHGVISSKIISITMMCNWLNQAWVPPNYTFNGGRQFTWDIPDEENISIINLPNNSASILSRPMRIFITYKS